MRRKSMKKKALNGICCIFLLLIMCSSIAKAQNLRRITPEEGLASSAVMCMHQSNDGRLWLGTLDGLNVYYGTNVERLEFPKEAHLEGYIIERILETDNNILWIQTGYGLKMLNWVEGIMTNFPQFTGLYIMRKIGHRMAVMDTKQQLHIFQPSDSAFVPIKYTFPTNEEFSNMGGTDIFFWTASAKGVCRYNWKKGSSNNLSLSQATYLTRNSVKYCTESSDPNILYIIDKQNHLYQLDIRQNKEEFILALGEDIEWRGMPSGIIEKNGAYFISFKVGGVVKLECNAETDIWQQTDLKIRTGVFEIMKDRLQDIIWIASDGQGLFAYLENAHDIQSYLYSDFNHSLEKPIRSLFIDNRNWLWIGTKGAGLLGIDRSNHKQEIYQCPQRLLTTSNSKLTDNSVYALSYSSYKGFWVGTETGINFFDYQTRSLQNVSCEQNVGYVHGIQEVGDSVLWIATVGTGIFKANIKKYNGSIRLDKFRHFNIDDGIFSSNYFFAMHYTSDGDLWLGNRGHGVFKMYQSGLKPTAWPNKQYSHLHNDVFALLKNENILWVGTGNGLIGLEDDGKEWFFNKEHGLPNNIIRSLQADSNGNLWISTNNGIAEMNPNSKEIRSYGRKDGLQISEFCDGASLQTDSVIYFGGLDGWVEIRKHNEHRPSKEYMPPFYFVKFKKYTGDINLPFLLQQAPKEDKTPTVELEHHENSFSIEVAVLDFVNSGSYTYLYKINSQNEDNWIENGFSNIFSFAQMPPGNHTLHVKYHNNITGDFSDEISIKIHIKPIWWQSPVLKFVYLLSFLACVGYGVLHYYRKTKQRHAYALQQMEHRHKEEVYEEKLRFFTNITHEFSTPLTLIYTPCERILTHEGTDEFVRKYVILIKKHTERLYRLIQEIIDYRRIETKHQQLNLERYNLSSYIDEECISFSDFAEKKGINLIIDIKGDIYWNMDKRYFPKIVNNLLSNALKYTSNGGVVKITLATLNEKELQLKVYNTGKGIKEEDRIRIFNRYSVLDKVEENASSILSHNGLGMAICHSTVLLLGGKIEINSEVNKYAEFVVTLPLLPLSEHGATCYTKDTVSLTAQNREINGQMQKLKSISNKNEEEQTFQPEYITKSTEKRPCILIIDDNKDVLFLLREVLSHDYEIKTAQSADEALELLRAATPQLIITDVMMPGTDGISLTKIIKNNKHTMHVPLILLSARNTDEDKTEGLRVGADAYIGKPFNVQYLQAVANRLIENRKNMDEYYNTSACAYDFVEGQLIKQEDKDFLYELNNFVEKNLLNTELTTEMIADALHMSARSLYRRFKELNLPSPKDYVKEWKMKNATRLLQTSDMSVQEIIYECGFNNRAHFYKEFSKRHGMTPKEFRNQKRNPDATLNISSETSV